MADTEDTKVGRFIFDSLTRGMYDNPLCIYREYIQNSADALDKSIQAKNITSKDAFINIQIDPTCSKVIIEDNGCGISVDKAKKILTSVGDSEKYGQRNRGFRGIGRLGGMAYCDKLIFHTKAKGETKETINTWDCKKLSSLLSPNIAEHRGMDLIRVIHECSEFATLESKRKNDASFFKVEMINVKCAKNILTDILELKSYLAQVAPVPFDYQSFPYGKNIDEDLRKSIHNYNTYKLTVNFEEVFKPHKISVLLHGKKIDKITSITPIEILDNMGKMIATGWRAERDGCIGAVSNSEGVSGIRVRVGNILIGDGSLLDKCFNEGRFNSYFIGEIHAYDSNLVPNSRRDDFEDSEIKELFYEKVTQTLAEPLTKFVRQTSVDHNKIKKIDTAKELVYKIKDNQKKGFVSEKHRDEEFKELRTVKAEIETLATKGADAQIRKSAEYQLERIAELEKEFLQNKETLVDTLGNKYSRSEKDLISKVLEHIYSNYDKAGSSVKLANIIIKKLSADR